MLSALFAGIATHMPWWGIFTGRPHGKLTTLTNGAITGTGTVVLDGHHQSGGLFGGVLVSCDGENPAVIQVRKNNASGELLVDVSTVSPCFLPGPIIVDNTQVLYYSITGTGALAQLYEARL